MTNETREKSFDCVKWTRERRNQMYEETKNMSSGERRRRRNSRRPTDPFLAKLHDRAKPPPSSRWRDQGSHVVGGRKATQLIVEIAQDEPSDEYRASALGGAIQARGASLEEIRVNVKAAVDRYLKDTDPLPRPKFIRLRFLRDEVIEA